MVRRILALSLVTVLLLCVPAFAERKDYINYSSLLPIVNEGEDITLRVALSQDSAFGGDVEQLWFWNWIDDQTNIRFDIEQISTNARSERVSLMFAAGDVPDLLYGLDFSTSELVKYGQADGQLLAFNDYLDADNAPTLMKWFEKYPEALQYCTAPDGNAYTLPKFQAELYMAGSVPRLFINQSWLAEAGLETPETLDAFTEMLRAFKANHPDSDPLAGGDEAVDPRHYLLNALGYNVSSGGDGLSPCLIDGHVVMPCYDANFIAYLTLLNQYYNEGLISADFFTNDSIQVRGLMAEGRVGVIAEPAFLSLPNVEDFQNWGAVKPLTSATNPKPQWYKPVLTRIGGVAASVDTEYPEVVMRFIDYHYTDEGAIYAWNGPLADSEQANELCPGWYFDENYQQHWVWIEDGTYNDEWSHHLGCVNSAYLPIGNEMKSVDNLDEDTSLMTYAQAVLQKFAGLERKLTEPWDPTNGNEHYRISVKENLMPYLVNGYPTYVYFTEEENNAMSDLRTLLKNYLKGEIAKFTTGTRALSEFDAFLSELKTIGIEEYIQYYVDGYAAYMGEGA